MSCQKIKNLFKEHWLIIITSFFLGCLIVLPTFVSIYKIGLANFKGVYPIFSSDETWYLAMTKEAADGHNRLGNVYLQQYKDSPFMSPPLMENIFAYSAKLMRISVPALFVVNDFVLPFIGLVCLYILFFNITFSKKISIVFALIFYLLFLNFFNRPLNPQASFILLILGILFIYKAVTAGNIGKQAKYIILAGFMTGILTYVYPFYWSSLIVLFAFNILFSLDRKSVYINLKQGILFLGIFAVISIPYLLNLAKAVSYPYYANMFLHWGGINSRLPSFFNFGLGIMALAVILLALKFIKDKRLKIFSLSLPAAVITLNWQNLITGKYLQFFNHYHQVSTFFMLILIIIILKELNGKLKQNTIDRKKIFFVFCGIILISFLIIYKQKKDIITGFYNLKGMPVKEFSEMQKMSDIFKWFNANTEADSVILSVDRGIYNIGNYLPVYTSNNLYFHSYAPFYLMPEEEIIDRWLRQNLLIKENINRESITKNQGLILGDGYVLDYASKQLINKIVKLLTGKQLKEPVLFPEYRLAEIQKMYDGIDKDNIEKTIKKYNLNYVLLNADEEGRNIEIIFRDYKFLKPVNNFNGYVIYQVI